MYEHKWTDPIRYAWETLHPKVAFPSVLVSRGPKIKGGAYLYEEAMSKAVVTPLTNNIPRSSDAGEQRWREIV